MNIKPIVTAIGSFEKTVSQTVVDAARNIADRVWNVFGDADISDEQMSGLLDAIAENATWKGTSSEAARRSEWKAFVTAVPYYLPEAINYYQKEFGGFTRVIMFRLARALPTAENYKQACQAVRDKIVNGSQGSGSNATPQGMPAIIGFLSKIKDVRGTAKINAFRRELAQLCEKHGIDY